MHFQHCSLTIAIVLGHAVTASEGSIHVEFLSCKCKWMCFSTCPVTDWSPISSCLTCRIVSIFSGTLNRISGLEIRWLDNSIFPITHRLYHCNGFRFVEKMIFMAARQQVWKAVWLCVTCDWLMNSPGCTTHLAQRSIVPCVFKSRPSDSVATDSCWWLGVCLKAPLPITAVIFWLLT